MGLKFAKLADIKHLQTRIRLIHLSTENNKKKQKRDLKFFFFF